MWYNWLYGLYNGCMDVQREHVRDRLIVIVYNCTLYCTICTLLCTICTVVHSYAFILYLDYIAQIFIVYNTCITYSIVY